LKSEKTQRELMTSITEFIPSLKLSEECKDYPTDTQTLLQHPTICWEANNKRKTSSRTYPWVIKL